jgi:hypothetical protein
MQDRMPCSAQRSVDLRDGSERLLSGRRFGIVTVWSWPGPARCDSRCRSFGVSSGLAGSRRTAGRFCAGTRSSLNQSLARRKSLLQIVAVRIAWLACASAPHSEPEIILRSAVQMIPLLLLRLRRRRLHIQMLIVTPALPPPCFRFHSGVARPLLLGPALRGLLMPGLDVIQAHASGARDCRIQ